MGHKINFFQPPKYTTSDPTSHVGGAAETTNSATTMLSAMTSIMLTFRIQYKYSKTTYDLYTGQWFWTTYGLDFYPRDAMLARVIEIATCLSVCLSVRPSVTRRYCVKTNKASVMISSPSGSPKTLVFRRQISSPNSKGFTPNGGLI